MIKVALIDNHGVIRMGVRAILEQDTSVTVNLECSNGKDFFSKLDHENCPDIVICDIYMPQMNGFEMINQLNNKHPGIKVIVFSMVSGKDAILHLIRSGVRAFLNKGTDSGLLLHSVKKVNETGWFLNNISKRVIEARKQTLKQKNGFLGFQFLSTREIEMLTLFASSLSYQDIAEKLNLEKKPLKTIEIDFIQN